MGTSLQLADESNKGPGFFSIFPILWRLVSRAAKRLSNPSTIVATERGAGPSGEKDEALVELEERLIRNPHQAQLDGNSAAAKSLSDGDLIDQVARGSIYLPAKDKAKS
ncbi:hypothetical protein [Pseudomonas saponiphila]|uniref:hypothetical protein n=1 Tax=Pseudomonas saponiphila TaxID=556534 RepID=UPI00115F7BEB|nr:hypothetical protein [Pseudomonas saponiphila]